MNKQNGTFGLTGRAKNKEYGVVRVIFADQSSVDVKKVEGKDLNEITTKMFLNEESLLKRAKELIRERRKENNLKGRLPAVKTMRYIANP